MHVLLQPLEGREMTQWREVVDQVGDPPDRDPEVLQPSSPQSAGLSQQSVQYVFGVGQVLHAAEFGELQRHVSIRVAGRPADGGSVEQEPGLHHADWDNAEMRNRQTHIDHCFSNLVNPVFQRFSFRVPMHEQDVTWE